MNNEIKQLRSNAKLLVPEILELFMDIKHIKSIKVRIKSTTGIKKKAKKKHIKFKKVEDIIGIRIITSSLENCYKIKDSIIDYNIFDITNIKDYIKNPTDLNKYQAIHIYFKYCNIPTEIQIHSTATSVKADFEHENYKKGLYKDEK